MIRVFLVPYGLSLSQDLPPTSGVAKLQQRLGQECRVPSKDVILLTPKGHLLDNTEILGTYDGGTEERPFYVYFRPSASPQTIHIEQPFKRNTRLEQALARITSSPSPAALQQQTSLAREFVQESVQLVLCSQRLHEQTRQLQGGWQAMLLNFSAMQRTFDKNQRTLDSVIRNFKESMQSYKNLLQDTPGQLEVLKEIVLPSFMSESVFGDSTLSLYNWINSQDEHSSLEDLLRECQQALVQVDGTKLDELQTTAANLAASAAELHQRETHNVSLPQEKEMEGISKEQKSAAQSLQTTVQRALGSGDAGTLANISLSNCQILKIMHTNHQQLENTAAELDQAKTAIKERIKAGLKSLARLQQDMTEVDTKIKFHCSQIQLMRRRFEVLEQVCAAPEMMTNVLNEINQRKAFKKFFVEEGQKVHRKFEQLRQQEKTRRESFLEKCGQHFVLSLFPSLTDRLPHLFNSVPQKFDEELCSLPSEELDRLLQLFPGSALNSDNTSFTSDGCTQTDIEGNEREDILTREMATQVLIEHVDVSEQTETHSTETETQTVLQTSTNICTQTRRTEQVNTEVQTNTEKASLTESNGTQTERPEYHDVYTQILQPPNGGVVDVSLQTDLAGIHNRLKMYVASLETAVQAVAAVSDGAVQVACQIVPNCTQTDIIAKPVSVDNCIQTHPPDILDIETQTDPLLTEQLTSGDLSGRVVALQAAVEGLQNQLKTERENHQRREAELEKTWKLMRRSLHESQELSMLVNITNLKIGDMALFMQDPLGNYLALTFDDRIYYLSERLSNDISSRSSLSLKRQVFIGCITEKQLVEVRKEINRLHVPVGHRLYKVSAREMPIH